MKYDLNISSAVGKDALTPGMYPVIIYQLIRQYSNENNKITIEDIMDTLIDYWKGDTLKSSSRTNIQKTLKRNLEQLLYFDEKIHAEYKDGKEFFVDSGDSVGKIKYLWYEQEITPTDLQLLSDAIIYSKHLPKKRRKETLKKLGQAAGQPTPEKSQWFNSIISDSEDFSLPTQGDLYLNLEYINDAIQNKNTLSFDFMYSYVNGKQYKVNSYNGVSPYRIIHNDGIYYMIAASTQYESKHYYFKKHKEKLPLLYFAIHKMRKLHTDFNTDYISISHTTGEHMQLSEFLNIGFSAPISEYYGYKFKQDIHLETSARGLDCIMDRFSKTKLRVLRRDEIDDRYTGSIQELSFTYDVIISNPTRSDYDTLLSLMLYYSEKDINLIEPSHFLTWIKSLMEIRIKKNIHKTLLFL